MNVRLLFRLLILLGLASGLLASFLDGLLADPLLDGLRASAREAIETLPRWRTVLVGFLGLIAIGCYFTGSLALLSLRGWGRPLYAAAHLLVLFGYLFGVPVVYGNLAFMLNELSMLAGGMVIAMMYLQPMAQMLSRR